MLFDMDGTLLDSRAAVVDAIAEGLVETYRHFDLPPPPLNLKRIAAAIGLPTPRFFRAAHDPQSVPLDLRDAFVAEFEVQSTRAEVAALLRGATALYPRTEETLGHLVAQGHLLLLYSNASEPYFEAVVTAHRLRRYFARTLCLEQAVRHRLARDKTGMVRYLTGESTAVVVVGDRADDIEAGRAVRARTIGCLYGFGDAAELALADWRIDALPELLGLPLEDLADPTAPPSSR